MPSAGLPIPRSQLPYFRCYLQHPTFEDQILNPKTKVKLAGVKEKFISLSDKHRSPELVQGLRGYHDLCPSNLVAPLVST